MAKLTFEEQAKVDRLAALEEQERNGTGTVRENDLKQAHWLAERAIANAEIREEMRAERQAEADAQAARVQAQRDAEALQAQEAYLRQARVNYPGTEVQWQQDKAEILRQWRIRNALGTDLDVLRERKRAELGIVL
jgi:hypothetical protein